MSDLIKAIEKIPSKGKIKIGIGVERGSHLERDFNELSSIEDFAEALTYQGANAGYDLVQALYRGEVDAAIRGSLSAKKTISAIKKVFKPTWMGRIAFLETAQHQSFLLAPVGIDEGMTQSDRKRLLLEGAGLLQNLGLTPNIAVLSGGRSEDMGRHSLVDRSINEAEELIQSREDIGEAHIFHPGILIEEALSRGANLVIAPDGISGNLIFRTLAYLGGGKGFGAPVMGIEKVFVDTSRNASIGEMITAVKIASSLCRIRDDGPR